MTGDGMDELPDWPLLWMDGWEDAMVDMGVTYICHRVTAHEATGEHCLAFGRGIWHQVLVCRCFLFEYHTKFRSIDPKSCDRFLYSIEMFHRPLGRVKEYCIYLSL